MRINKLLTTFMVFLISLASLVYANPQGTNVVISEVLYNPNGSSENGKEWIELYNPTTDSIDISSWSVFKEDSTSLIPTITFPSGTTIAPYSYLLIGDNGPLPLDLPTPDFITQLTNLLNSGDGIALKDGAFNIIDAVGWASVVDSNFYEGTEVPYANLDGYSIERKVGSPCGNAVDTDNNAYDFFNQENPNPQNSANATETPCNATPDTTPPSSITNLQATDVTNESITWEWINPTEPDFYQTIVYLDDGINYKNLSSNYNYVQFIELKSNTDYTIIVYTKDLTGNINKTDVSNTVRTLANTPVQCTQDSDCDDSVPCTTDSCNEDTGLCDNVPDNSYCDDSNECTQDVCDPPGGCFNTPEALSTPCEADGIGCTIYHCDGLGSCVLLEDQCGCLTDDNCTHLTDTCNIGKCNLETNTCYTEQLPDETPCDDTEFCTINNVCDNGICYGLARDCSDGVSCTIDSCDETSDECINNPDDDLCDNSLYCDGTETCDALLDCQAGVPVDCSSNDVTGIATCYNIPDGIDYTWDYRNTFESDCVEEIDGYHCTTGNQTITHNCDKSCGAECETNDDCSTEPNGICNLETCSCEYGPYCGDNVVNQPSEECDGTNLAGKDCTDYGYANPDILSCLPDCSGFDTSNCEAVCGNNVLEPGEQCDDGDLIDGDGCSSICKKEVVDDLQINYLRGKITYDGVNAQAGTSYLVEVISGDNIGRTYEGEVDDNNVFLKGEGNFDTNDQLIFSTGDSFRITTPDCNNFYEGTFENGGNDGIILDCLVLPEISNIFHTPTVPTDMDEVAIYANITDNIGIDKAFVYHSVNNGNNESVEMIPGPNYSANIGNFSAYDLINYYILANDSYGNIATSSVYSFNVIAYMQGDVNKDGSVNILDMILVRRAFGKLPSDPDWNPDYDINNDGQINILDMILIRRNFT